MICVFAGPCCCGKSTLVDYLVDLDLVVKQKAITTRPKRSKNDNEYGFVSELKFDRLKNDGRLIAVREYNVVENGNPAVWKYAFHKLGEDPTVTRPLVMIADMEGAKAIQEQYGERNVIVFCIYTPYSLRKKWAEKRPGYEEAEFIRRAKSDKEVFTMSNVIKVHGVTLYNDIDVSKEILARKVMVEIATKQWKNAIVDLKLKTKQREENK